MNAKEKLLEVYGLLHFIFGVGQLVSIGGGYFLSEFILRSPEGVISNLLDENLVTLAYLAIILRSAFHIIIGVGIARIKLWVRPWILWGWIGMIIIAFSLAHAFWGEWSQNNGVENFTDIFSWPKVLLYISFIVFEVVFIRRAIFQIGQQSQEAGLNVKNIGITFGVAVSVFILVMFLGHPVKQGFHQGFYKSRGQKVEETKKILKNDFESSSLEEAGQSLGPVVPAETSSVLIQKKEVVEVEAPKPKVIAKEAGEVVQTLPRIEETQTNEGFPYKMLLGFLGGFCIIAGLLGQVYAGYAYGSIIQTKGISYTLLAFGFILWTIYGLIGNLSPITLGSLLAGILSLVLIFIQSKL